MTADGFEAAVPGGVLAGRVSGSGAPVLLLHGGPGLGYDYLEELVPELETGYRVARYQQRGLPPSTAGAPYDVATQSDDVTRVLDALGFERAVVVGHSWGGHLLLHLLARHPGRLMGAVVVDPLGGVGDGGEAGFSAVMEARTPPDDLARMVALDERAMAGEGTAEEALESFGLVWPAYFADPTTAPPMEVTAMSVEAYSATFDSLHEELPGLAARLAGCTVPTVFVHGAASPMPVSASSDTAAAMGPSATVVVVEGAGHFIWHERPGAVRAALDDLVASL